MMSTGPRRTLPFIATLFLVLAGSCKDDTTEPNPPVSLAIATGDNQTVTPGGTTRFALIARVRDARDLPIQGVTMTWAITSGTGTLSAATTVTEQNGFGFVNFTAGSTTGVAKVTATVATLTPVTFTVNIGATTQTP